MVSARKTVASLEPPPDVAALVAAARRGDSSAQEALFRRYAKLAAGIASRLLGADDELEDVVQDSFAVAFSRLESLNDPAAFSGWLASIVTGRTIATIRRRRLLARFGLRSRETVHPESIIASGAPADVLVELREVYQLVLTLPVEQRVMLILRRVEELTLEEIAERTGRSLATVKRRLASAEEKLAELHGAGANAGAERTR